MQPDELELTHEAILPTVRRWPLVVLCVLAIGFLLVLGLAGNVMSRAGARNLSGLNVDLSVPLPSVEPFVFQNVPKEIAKKINDSTPFTAKPVPPAAPFRFAGSNMDFDRAVDCLAATIFYEAGNEKLEGQMAVVQVVLNRARHPAYPRTVCGVVFQGHERRTGCQFSYTCDGSMLRQPSVIAWERFRGIATSMLRGAIYAPVGTATHYHTDWVLPAWSAKLEKIRAEQSHLFFRWAGVWGLPKAFRGVYAGGEQAYGKLGILSLAHRTPDFRMEDILQTIQQTPELAAETLSTDPLTPTTALPMPGEVPTATDAIEKAKNTFVLYASASTDPSLLPVMAERTCAGRSYCKVMAWSDRSAMPKSLPLDDAARGKLAFSYLRDSEAGFDKALWDCTIFPRPDKKQCIRKPIITHFEPPKADEADNASATSPAP
jgi:hypothetical protein